LKFMGIGSSPSYFIRTSSIIQNTRYARLIYVTKVAEQFQEGIYNGCLVKATYRNDSNK